MASWEGINEFVAVADTGSFTAGAKRLKLSTAQVSRQVSQLEGRLAIKLFYRTTRKVSLTQEGQVYLQHCRQILEGLEAAEQALTKLQQAPQGKIKITAPVTYGEEYIVPLVNNFQLKFPALKIEYLLTNQTLDLVEGGFDLAIRLGQLSDSSMMAKKLASRTQYVCASPDYINNFGIAHSLSELNQHNCLTGTHDYWSFQENGKTQNIKINGNIRCNSGYGLVDAALKGIGIIQLPDYYVKDCIENGQLISMLDQYQQAEEGIWALYPHNRHLSSKIKWLIEYLQQELGAA